MVEKDQTVDESAFDPKLKKSKKFANCGKFQKICKFV